MEFRTFYRSQWLRPKPHQRIKLTPFMISKKRSNPNIFKVLFTKPFYRVNNRKPLAGLDTISHVMQRAFLLLYHITMITGSADSEKVCQI